MYSEILEKIIEKRQVEVLQENYHKHHIIPRHLGGSDEEENLVRLTIREHCIVHYLMWKIDGRWQDFTAYRLLRFGNKDPIGMRTLQSEAGRAGGLVTRQGNLGIFSPDYDRAEVSRRNIHITLGLVTKEEKSAAGKIGGRSTKEKKVGIFRPDLQHLRPVWAKENGSLGGISARDNKTGIFSDDYVDNHLRKTAAKAGKRGGKVVGSMLWWNDGTVNKKSFECPGEGFVRGQLMSEKKRAAAMKNFARRNTKRV